MPDPDWNNYVSEDPVVVYDLMREAANRLKAVYIAQVDGDDPDAAMARIQALIAEVRAVDPTDVGAQRAAMRSFDERYEQAVGR